MNRGFISLGVATIIAVVAVMAGGGVYTAYKYSMIVSENEQMKIELLQQKEDEIAVLEQKLEEVTHQVKVANLSTATTSSSSKSTSELENHEQHEEEVPVKEIVRTTIKYVPIEVPSEGTHLNKGDETQVEQKYEPSRADDIEVQNVKEDLNEDDYSIRITWETSVDSDSRLILEDDQIFSSDHNNSDKHSVKISALEASKKYNYEIVAEVGGIKDSHFGKFQAPREFIVQFESVDEECTNVIVEDTAGYPLINTKLELSGTYSGSSTNNWLGEKVVDYTNGRGEIEYCDPIERFLVENVESGEVYYDTR